MKLSSHQKGVLMLILAHLIWGVGAPLFKYTLQFVSTFELASVRFLGAGVILLPFFAKRLFKIEKKYWPRIFAGALIGVYGLIVLFFEGLKRTSAIEATLIAPFVPISTYLLARKILKERSSRKIVRGIVWGVAGVVIIVLGPLIFDQVARWEHLEGNLLLMGAMFCMALEIIILRPVVQVVSPLLVTCAVFLIAGVMFLMSGLATGQMVLSNFLSLDSRASIGVLWGIFGSSLASYTLYYAGLARISAKETGLFGFFDPLSGILVATIFFSETLTIGQIAGGALIAFAIWNVEKRN